MSDTKNRDKAADGGLRTTALFGSSDWRAEGWEAAMKSAKTGDRFTGQQRDGSWIDVTVRVLEGTMEGRHQIRFVYVGWEKNGQHCESTFECFATMHRRIESLPNVEAMRGGAGRPH